MVIVMILILILGSQNEEYLIITNKLLFKFVTNEKKIHIQNYKGTSLIRM